MQTYVYADINLGDLKKKLLDRTYEGPESRYLNSTGDDSSSNTKLALLKDANELLKNSLTSYLTLKAYCKEKDHLHKISEETSEAITNSFEFTIHRTALKMPICVKSFINHLSLIDDVFQDNSEFLAAKVNNFIIRLLSTIKVCNSLGAELEKSKESSEDDSESNSEKIESSGMGEVLDSATAEKLKITLPYLIQLLNKTVVNACSQISVEKVQNSFSFYMESLFNTEKKEDFQENIVDFSHIALKGLNGLFITSSKNNEVTKERVSLFSKYFYEQSLVYLFSNVQNVFSNPSIIENEDQSLTLKISENIKFITNVYISSQMEQKDIIIDTIIKMLLGILTGIQEKKIQRTKSILNIINAAGDGLYSIIVNGDQNLAKNYIATSLSDPQKQMLQNVIKAIATTKKAQEQSKGKGQSGNNQRASGNPKFRENQNRIKLATKIGK